VTQTAAVTMQQTKGKPTGGKSLQEMFSKIQAQHRQRFGGQQVSLKPTEAQPQPVG